MISSFSLKDPSKTYPVDIWSNFQSLPLALNENQDGF